MDAVDREKRAEEGFRFRMDLMKGEVVELLRVEAMVLSEGSGGGRVVVGS